MKPEKRRQRAKKKAKQARILKFASKFAGKAANKLTSKMSKEQGITALGNLMDAGRISPDRVKQEMIKAAEDDIRKQIRSGKATTVEALTKTLDVELEFMKLCKRVGLDKEFFERLAETILKEENYEASDTK